VAPATTRQFNRQIAPRWGVVMTVNEPAALVLCNVHWHLETGASAVHVCLDDPSDMVAEPLSAIQGCHVTVCDEGHWARHRGRRGRPASQMRRQTINANAAKAVAQTDWLFHIDADEFIWQDSPLSDALAGVGSDNTEVNLPVLERLFPRDHAQASLFDGIFRATADLPEADQSAAYGPFAALMKRGQYSHGAGKSGVRVRDDLRLGVHNATEWRDGRWRRAARHVADTARLLHFDGLTPLHWLIKIMRYRRTPPEVQKTILHPHRAAQIEWMLARSETFEAARAAHAVLFNATPGRCAQLAQFDLLRAVPFDPVAVLGKAAPDLSPAAFDADLLSRNPWARNLPGLNQV